MFTAAAAAARNKANFDQPNSKSRISLKRAGEGLEDTSVIINPIYGYQKRVKHPRKSISGRERSSSMSSLSGDDSESRIYIKRYYKFTINPNVTYKLLWDALVAVIVIYSIIMVPLQLAFSTASDGAFVVIDWIVDGLFMVDIIINFFTAYNDSRGTVYSNCMIVKHYFKTWFIIDLVSTIPFDKIFSSASSALKLMRLLKALRLLKLLKLFRVLKLSRYIDTIKESFPGNDTLFTLLTFSVTLTLAGHLMACLWYGTISMDSNNDLNWIHLSEDIDLDNTGKQYVVSLYWAFTTMTTVGFGDIVAESISEKIVASICMVIGAAVLGYVLGNISSLLQDYNLIDVARKKQMERLKNYCYDRNVPTNLRKRLEAHQKYSQRIKSVIDEDDLLNKFPSRDHIGLIYKEYSQIIEDVRVLKEFYNYTAVCQFVHVIYPFYAIKGEFIMLRGEIAYQIYVLRSGKLYYGLPVNGKIDPKKSHIVTSVMGEMPKYEFFGKDALNEHESIYSYNILCEVKSELLFARNVDVLPMINTYPYLRDNMFKYEVKIMNKLSKTARIEGTGQLSSSQIIRPKESSRFATPIVLGRSIRDRLSNSNRQYLDSPDHSPVDILLDNKKKQYSKELAPPPFEPITTQEKKEENKEKVEENRESQPTVEQQTKQNTFTNTTTTTTNNYYNNPLESVNNNDANEFDIDDDDDIDNNTITFIKNVRNSKASERASTTSNRTSIISQESSFRAFKKHHYVIYPYHPFKIIWDLYIAVLILYSVIEVPFVIAFEVKLPEGLHIFDLYIITISFVIDMILSFNTGLINSFDAPNYKRKDICKSYLKFWFWIDLISTIPFDELFVTTSGGLKAIKLVKVIRLIRLVRLIRLLKLDKIMQKYDDYINPTAIQIIKQLFIMLFIAHLVGCLWYGVSAYSITEEDPDSNWISGYCVYQNASDYSDCLPLKNETLGIKYLTSIYFSFALMGTVGYGDIHANHLNIAEMLVSCFLLVVGTTTMSYLISSVMGLVLNVNPGKAIRSDKLRLINGYSDDIGLSDDMTKRLKKISDYTLTMQSGFDTDNLFRNFPNLLKREVLEISTDPIVSTFSILNELEQAFPGFVSYIWPLFRCYQALPNDYLWKTGEDINELYFIFHGQLRVSKMDGQTTLINIGSILGEAAMLIPLSVYCINCSDCQAVITSQILSLQRNQLDYIKGVSHEVYNQMKLKLLHNIEVEQPIYIDPVNIDDEIRDMHLCIESYCPPRSTHEFLTDVNITNITEGEDVNKNNNKK